MARIRTIKQAFFLDWDLYRAEAAAGLPLRLAFASLWPIADRAGRFCWKPEELKPQCLPFDAVDFGAVLAALHAAGFVRHYQVDGACFGYLPSWPKHQVPNQREAESAIPGPDGNSAAITCTHVHAPVEGKGREGNGSGNGNGESAEPRCDSTPATPAADAMTLRREPPTRAPMPVRARADDGPVLLTFPVVGAEPHEWRLRRVQVEEWGRLFPGLDVLAECRHALAWVQAHPGRRKTAKGMPRFLVGWFTRTVDRRGANGTAAVPGKSRLTTALERASEW